MALKIIYENKESAGPKVKVDRRLCLNAAGKLVEADDPGAVALYCSAGKTVARADFEERGGVVEAVKKPEPEPEPETKAAPEVIAPKVIKKKVTKKKTAKKKATKKKVTKKKRS